MLREIEWKQTRSNVSFRNLLRVHHSQRTRSLQSIGDAPDVDTTRKDAREATSVDNKKPPDDGRLIERDLEQPAFRKAHGAWAGDDEVVEYTHINERQRLFERLR